MMEVLNGRCKTSIVKTFNSLFDLIAEVKFDIIGTRMMSQWEAAASDFLNSVYVPEKSVDGDVSTFWINKGATHSWLKIKMDMERWVKGVRFRVRNTHFMARTKYAEVHITSGCIPLLIHIRQLNVHIQYIAGIMALIVQMKCSNALFL